MPHRFAAHFADTFTDTATPPAPNRFAAHFADTLPSAEPPPQPLRATGIPRTWGEIGKDTFAALDRGVAHVAEGIVGMPVDALNFVNLFSPAHFTPKSWGLHPPVMSQPQAVRDLQTVFREGSQGNQDLLLSEKARRQMEEFDQVDGFVDAGKYLLQNPSFLGTSAVEQVPQLAMAVPGRLKTTIALQSALAGSMNESETAAELAPRVAAGEMAQAEADRRTLDVFTGTALLNAGTAALPGAQTLERLVAGQAARVPAGRALGHVATSFLGEAAQEGITEAGEQVLQNLATDKPWNQDAGKMGALGALLGGPMGGAGSTVEALAGRSAPPEQAPQTDFLHAAMEVMREQQNAPQVAVQKPETTDVEQARETFSKSPEKINIPSAPDIDALLTQNLPNPTPGSDPQGKVAPVSLTKDEAKVRQTPETDADQGRQLPEQARIEDFGEKLGGARKDAAAALRAQIDKADLATQPLSKIWPKSDIDKIKNPALAAALTVLRDRLPAKPKRHSQAWAMDVKFTLERAQKLISGELPLPQLKASLPKDDISGHDGARLALLERIGREHWSRIGRVFERPEARQKDAQGHRVPAPYVRVTIDGKQTYFDNATSVDQIVEAVQNRLADKAIKPLQFEVRTDSVEKETFINKKGDPDYTRLRTFQNPKEAFAFLRSDEGHQQLTQAWDAHKENANVKKNDVRRKDNLPRSGQDWRKGQDVAPERFTQAFGFRGVEFGNWVGKNNRERQESMNEAHDALMDLADILEIPSRALSLNGTLGLAFGSRGKGKANAHFEPNRIVINLTKTRGAGSLAHEWLHALDNYFSRISERNSFITKHHRASENPNARHEVQQAFERLVRALDQSPMTQRAAAVDKGKPDGYWSRITERAARSFENYVIAEMEAKGVRNDYLANVVPPEQFKRDTNKYPYLLPDEIAPIKQAFDDLFSTLQTREDDNGNVALFNRRQQGESKPVTRLTGEEITTDLSAQNVVEHAREWFKTHLQGRSIQREGLSPVRISGKGWNKLKRGLTTDLDKARLIPAIPDIIQSGEYLGRFPIDKVRADDIVAFHHFQASVSLAGKDVVAGVSVAEDSFGNLFYNLNRDPQALLAKKKGSAFTQEKARGAEPLEAPPPNQTTPPHKGGGGFGESAFSRTMDDGGAEINLEILLPPVERVQATVDTIKKALPHAPEIVIARDMQDSAIPQSVRDYDAQQRKGGASGEVDGFYYQGKVYLNAANLNTDADVARVLFHEVLGHHGLRGAFGEALHPLLDELAEVRTKDIAAKRKEYGLPDTAEGRRLAAEEVLASMAETTPELGWVKRAITAIRTWLRKAGLNLALSDNDLIAQFILPARDFVQRAEQAQSRFAEPVFNRGEQGRDWVAWSMQQVSSAPMRTATNFQQARDAAKAFQGKQLTNQQTGMIATVSRKSLDKMLSESAVGKSESPAVQSAAVANADSLFERAVLGWSKPDRASNPDLKAIHRFFAPMDIDGHMKMVKLTVKEMVRAERSNSIYTLEAVNFSDENGRQWLEDAAREDGVDLDKKNPQRGEREGEIASHGPRASRRGFRPEGRAAGDVRTLAQAITQRNQNPESAAFSRKNPDTKAWAGFTEAQQDYLTKAGLRPDTRGLMQKLRDWGRGKLPWDTKIKLSDHLMQGGVDRYWGLKRAVAKAEHITPETDPYQAALRIQTASTMEAVLKFGAPDMDASGALKVKRNKDGTPTVPGLIAGLAPVWEQLPQFFGWMVARRAQLLKSQGRENLMSDEDIAIGLAFRKGNEAAFDQAARNYLQLKNAILDLAEQHGGTIDPVARAAWDHIEYIPFYRTEADEGRAFGPGTRKGLSNQSAGIRQLTGSDKHLNDPLSNIVQNFTRLIDSAMKNRAMLLAVDGLKDTGYFEKLGMDAKPETVPLSEVKQYLQAQGLSAQTLMLTPKESLDGIARMLTLQAPMGDDVVRVMRQGKAEYYRVADPLLLRALTAFHDKPVATWMKALIWPKQVLTAGATMTGDFILRNFFRDTGEATITSKHRFIPIYDTARGAIETLRETPLTQDLMMAGSYFHGGLFHQGDYEATGRAIRRALRQHGISESKAEAVVKSLLNPKRIWDAYRRVAESTEMGSRVMLAKRRMQAGGNFAEASLEAKDFLNFQQRGDSAMMQFFINTLPFLNARIQGNYRLARVMSASDRRKSLLAKLAVLASASAALYAWNMLAHADAYDDLEDWDKDTYWHFAPGTKYHFRLPKPFELGLFGGTLIERSMAAFNYHFISEGQHGDRPEQGWAALLHGLIDTLAMNPTPQAVRPLVELHFNENMFTGRPIESQGDAWKAPSERKTPHTSETLVQVSKGMEALLDDKAPSAKQLQHLWRGYFAGMGMYFMNTVDAPVRWLTDAPEKPEKALRDLPVIGTFARGSTPARNTAAMTQLYDWREEAQTRSRAVKAALDNGDVNRARNLEAEWGWLIGPRVRSSNANGGFMHAGVQQLERTARELAALRRSDNEIYSSRTLTPAQKRQRLDANAERRNTLARQRVNQLREREYQHKQPRKAA